MSLGVLFLGSVGLCSASKRFLVPSPRSRVAFIFSQLGTATQSQTEPPKLTPEVLRRQAFDYINVLGRLNGKECTSIFPQDRIFLAKDVPKMLFPESNVISNPNTFVDRLQQLPFKWPFFQVYDFQTKNVECKPMFQKEFAQISEEVGSPWNGKGTPTKAVREAVEAQVTKEALNPTVAKLTYNIFGKFSGSLTEGDLVSGLRDTKWSEKPKATFGPRKEEMQKLLMQTAPVAFGPLVNP